MFKRAKQLLNRLLENHITVGPLTVYGANAMHWAAELRLPLGLTLCAHPTTRTFGGRWPWYAYLSTNGTPWGALWAVGPGVDNVDKRRAEVRREVLHRLVHSDAFEAPGVEPASLFADLDRRVDVDQPRAN